MDGLHGSAERRRAAGGADALDELVHLPAVERLLLVAVVVILVAGELASGAAGEAGRRAVEPRRLRGVRVARQQRRRQPVDVGRVRRRGERLAVGVGRVRIRAEVVVEGDVLLEDHDQMPDGRARVGAVSVAVTPHCGVRRCGEPRCGSTRRRPARAGVSISSSFPLVTDCGRQERCCDAPRDPWATARGRSGYKTVTAGSHGKAAVLLGHGAQPLGERRREPAALELPRPVSVGVAGMVHARVAVEAEHVLRGNDGERRARPEPELDQPPVRLGRIEARRVALALLQVAEPADGRVGVVRARVDDLVDAVVLEAVRAAARGRGTPSASRPSPAARARRGAGARPA